MAEDKLSSTQRLKSMFGKPTEGNSALNKTMSSFATSNIKSLNTLNKSIQSLDKNLSQLAKPTQTKKDFVKREDPIKQQTKKLNTIAELMKESNDLEKNSQKKKGNFLMGLLKGAAFALAGGGLLGFLMTGKKEFLFSVIKGFKKAFFDIPAMMFKGIKSTKSLFKIVDVIKDIGKFGKLIGKVFSRFGGKGVAKLVGKKVGKGIGKAALTKIPGIGTIMGLVFGIARFKKGDVIGGIGEIVSGIASMFPGPGTAISLAVDAALLFRDFKMAKQEPKKPKKGSKTDWRKIPIIGGFIDMFDGMKMMIGGDPIGGIKMSLLGLNGLGIPGVDLLISKTLFPIVDATSWLVKGATSLIGRGVSGAKKAISMAPMAYEQLKEVPVIGHYIRGIEGLINFAKDPKKGVENIAGFMENMVPGSGEMILKVGSAIFGAADWIMAKGKGVLDFAGKAGDWLKGKGKNILEDDKAVSSNLRGGPGDVIKLKDGKHPEKPKSIGIFGMLKQQATRLLERTRPKTGAGGIPGPIGGLQFANSGVDFAGLDPSLQHNYLGMVGEWLSLPKNAKRMVQVNSANRSLAQQAALVKNQPGFAAPVGKSMHNYGRAIDMNSREANDMSRSGLMKKWGFEQPGVVEGWKKPEPWHIEPIGQSSQMVRSGLAQPMDTPKQDIGDAYALTPKSMPGINLPSGPIAGKARTSTSNKLDLSDSTIQALAMAMGASFKGAMPKGQGSSPSGMNIAMRG